MLIKLIKLIELITPLMRLTQCLTLMLREALVCLLIFLLAACSSSPAVVPSNEQNQTQGQADPASRSPILSKEALSETALSKKGRSKGAAQPGLMKRMENAIAGEFLTKAEKLLAVEGAIPMVKLKRIFEQFSQDVNQEQLTAYNYRQWELLGYLLEAETLRRNQTDFAGTITRLTSLQPSLPSLEAAIQAEIDRLGQLGSKKGGRAQTPRTTHPPNTVAGRQDYLDRLAETLFQGSTRWSGKISPYAMQEMALNGTEGANALFSYQQGKQELTIDLAKVSYLPYFELPALAAFYGFPGLHTLHASAADTEVQQFFHLPGYTRGWALYITAWLAEHHSAGNSNSRQAAQVQADMIYWVRFQLAKAKADLKLGLKEWKRSDAWLFLGDYRRYGNDRLNLALQEIEDAPGHHLATFVGYQRFQQLTRQCAARANCDLDQLHQRIVILGPLTFRLLEGNL